VISQANLQQIFSDALLHHRSGRLSEAENLYRQILTVDGRHADSLHLLGLIAYQQGRYDVAVELIGQAIRSRGDVPAYHGNLGAALKSQGKLGEAIAQYERALALAPDYAEGHNNLGTALMMQGHLARAQARFERALVLNPSYAEASYNFGLALERQGRFDEAQPHYARAQSLKPDYAEAYYTQASTLQRQGKNVEAVLLYERTLALHPGHVDARNNLGVALQNLGRLDEAVTQYRRALALDPANANACNNLASALQRQGDLMGAIVAGRRALDLRDTAKTRRVLVECLKRLSISQMDDDVRDLMRRALFEVWARPAELAPAVIGAVKSRSETAGYAGQAESPRLAELTHIADDPLMLCLLRSVPICDPQLEQLFTACRAALLDEVSRNASDAEFTQPILNLACALAEQCFINEYVFACSADEARLVLDLETRVSARLEQRAPVPLPWLVTLSAYRPLMSLQGVERLEYPQLPQPVASLLELQVSAPLEERRYQAEITCLTPIHDDVSSLVRKQYEENPYPRWLKLPMGGSVQSIEEMIVSSFPGASIRPLDARRPDVLIAGCGTGQHSITTARLFPTGNILAVDLSRASLSYAMRKTRELGLQNIRYAQADILELRGLGRQFDLIESSGVLHHLADPLAGLEVLVSLLRPNGLMKLGLYSEIARRPVVEIRRHIAAQGYAPSAEDIRRCRQDILALPGGDVRRKVLTFSDFYSMSECRDLLFHVQEHRLTLPAIAAWFGKLDLTFVAFDVPLEIEQVFDARFPERAARTNLESWHLFEQDNPNVFVGMYQFWVQKGAPTPDPRGS
jgi:tetratricopeptide (TPR) repeat protein/2-polyprenyl-3-methyl-5-hydroxy-6-metoxy-1,4-benzoquinol methylase